MLNPKHKQHFVSDFTDPLSRIIFARSVMGGVAMEEMPLSALFEEARKIHLAASESRADQVGKLLPFYTNSIN